LTTGFNFKVHYPFQKSCKKGSFLLTKSLR
jgi:hypothetical protein